MKDKPILHYEVHLRLTSSAVTPGEVASLNHEILDDPVEFAALVAITMLTKKRKSKWLNIMLIQWLFSF